MWRFRTVSAKNVRDAESPFGWLRNESSACAARRITRLAGTQCRCAVGVASCFVRLRFKNGRVHQNKQYKKERLQNRSFLYRTLFTEQMTPNRYNHGSCAHPAVWGFRGIIIVYRTAWRIPAVNGVTRRLFGFRARLHAPIAVIDTGKRTGLIDHTCNWIGERWMRYAVKNHRTDRHLSRIGLSAGFGGDYLSKQIDIVP